MYNLYVKKLHASSAISVLHIVMAAIDILVDSPNCGALWKSELEVFDTSSDLVDIIRSRPLQQMQS